MLFKQGTRSGAIRLHIAVFIVETVDFCDLSCICTRHRVQIRNEESATRMCKSQKYVQQVIRNSWECIRCDARCKSAYANYRPLSLTLCLLTTLHSNHYILVLLVSILVACELLVYRRRQLSSADCDLHRKLFAVASSTLRLRNDTIIVIAKVISSYAENCNIYTLYVRQLSLAETHIHKWNGLVAM